MQSKEHRHLVRPRDCVVAFGVVRFLASAIAGVQDDIINLTLFRFRDKQRHRGLDSIGCGEAVLIDRQAEVPAGIDVE